ncbi:MAG: PSP1 domain-containing protein [Planctomycetota bacterium]|jgi:cell fate regulator YaaT (PSP1 superfamily)
MARTAGIKPKQAKNKKYMLVRYGRMGMIGWFEHNESQIPKVPKRVVMKTERGLELGDLVGQLCPYRAGQFRLDMEQTDEYFKNSEIDYAWSPIGRFVRYATADDLSEERHLAKIAQEEMQQCIKVVKEMDLPMKIVDAEHVFGGERIVFFFMSEGRVDFRDLVKKLAHDYQTRIEMRQIGSRDEAKLLGDFESCGQECCCRRFLKALKPVNMRMAKMQKATLDPAKISGYCGRLKCCLRYEDENYVELKKKLPKKNTPVKTSRGSGRVIDTQILTQLVLVGHDDGVKMAVPLDELEIVTEPPKKIQKQKDKEENGDDNKPNNNNNRNNRRKR